MPFLVTVLAGADFLAVIDDLPAVALADSLADDDLADADLAAGA